MPGHGKRKKRKAAPEAAAPPRNRPLIGLLAAITSLAMLFLFLYGLECLKAMASRRLAAGTAAAVKR